MHWKHHNQEEIVSKLERVRVAIAEGVALADAIVAERVSESTYFRWKSQYGGLTIDQLRHMKKLELENARLRQILVELESPALARRA